MRVGGRKVEKEKRLEQGQRERNEKYEIEEERRELKRNENNYALSTCCKVRE